MLDRTLEHVSLLMARVGGGLLFLAALLVTMEVLLRKSGIAVFSMAGDYSSYALAIGSSWTFTYVLFERAHVRVDVLMQRLSPRPKALFDVMAMASLAVVGLILTFGCTRTFMQSLELGSRANATHATPLAIPQGLWVFGLAWFTVVGLYRTCQAARAFLAGNLGEVTRIAAPANLSDEIDDAARTAESQVLEPKS